VVFVRDCLLLFTLVKHDELKSVEILINYPLS